MGFFLFLFSAPVEFEYICTKFHNIIEKCLPFLKLNVQIVKKTTFFFFDIFYFIVSNY